MNENAPLISVVISYYNDKAFLADVVKSVLGQTYQNFELVLFNHASTDGSREIARSFDDARIIHIDADRNLGAGASYNLCYIMPFVKGFFYKPFSADDIMAPDCLKDLVEYSKEHPDKDLIFGNVEYVNTKGKSLRKDWFRSVKTFSKTDNEIDLLKMFAKDRNSLPCPGAMVKTDCLRAITIDQSLTIYADKWLWASLLLRGAKIGFCDKIVACYRLHGYQESSFDKDVVRQRIEYEKAPFLSLFFNLSNVETAKTVFQDSPYADRLTDPRDVPFYVAEYFLRKDGYPFAYEALFKMMLDDETRGRLECVFDFDVLKLRELYAFRKKSFKRRVYAKQPKRLTLIELLFLLSRKCLRILISLVTFRFLRRRRF